MGAKLDCQWEAMQPSRTTPSDVNHVRPADIKIVAAMGDSYVIGTLSRNNDDEMVNVFPGNSFVTGADEPLRKHISLANILKQFNPSLVGASYGNGYHNTNFNVAVCRNQSVDLVWQAKELIHRIKSREDSPPLMTLVVASKAQIQNCQQEKEKIRSDSGCHSTPRGVYSTLCRHRPCCLSVSRNYDMSRFQTDLLGKWKLICMFVGTYDLGRLNCCDPVTK
ncbi:hypothetical protein ANCDUO_18352, partial [Ancylostoma duodenale]